MLLSIGHPTHPPVEIPVINKSLSKSPSTSPKEIDPSLIGSIEFRGYKVKFPFPSLINISEDLMLLLSNPLTIKSGLPSQLISEKPAEANSTPVRAKLVCSVKDRKSVV